MSPQEVRREVVYERVLSRVFTCEPDCWVLKGGFALILREGHIWQSRDANLAGSSIQDFERLLAFPMDDGFRFGILKSKAMTGGAIGHRVTVAATVGERDFDRVRFDVVSLRGGPNSAD
ncbi:MAG: nucleotidyl transferase AbiEii/AbiGii toxin family protein [Acidimicrobiales bacterium]